MIVHERDGMKYEGLCFRFIFSPAFDRLNSQMKRVDRELEAEQDLQSKIKESLDEAE